MNKPIIENSRILVADDNYETLTYIGKIFSELNLTVFSASHGKQALAIAKVKIPDLILLDVSMPDMGGFDVCMELKKNEATHAIPVIFITGKTDSSDIQKGFLAGGTDYITKPFSKEELVLRVLTQLERIKMQEKILEDTTKIHLQEMELLQKQKEKFEYELQHTYKELQGMMIQIQRFNGVFNELTISVKNLLNSEDSKIKEELPPILHKALTQFESNNWAEIETRFIKVHKDFYEKLITQFPDLTKNELKLCALLRLNLSTKEISNITLQSEEAVKKARYRLKQKLNTESDQSLINKIFSI